MKIRIICMMLLTLTLCGCTGTPAEKAGTDAPESQASCYEEPARDVETRPAETESLPETTATAETVSQDELHADASGSSSAETDTPEQLTEAQQDAPVFYENSDSEPLGDLLPRDNS